MSDYRNNRVLHFPSGSATADRVYGQGGDFTTSTSNKGGLSATSLSGPYGVAVDTVGGLYVADLINFRVLHYPPESTTADRVYGQNGSFTTTYCNQSGGISATCGGMPMGISADVNGLYVAEGSGSSRVLHYPANSITADRVYGQGGDFTSSTTNKGGISASSFDQSRGVVVDSGGGVYVSDTYNHRILHYPNGSTVADRVYGQGGDFTSSTANKGGISAASLNLPQDSPAVDADGGLYVPDYGNARVLHFPAGSTTADQVYGQGGDFSQATQGTTASRMRQPTGVSVDSAGGVYVADSTNNRVLYLAETATSSPTTFSAAATSGDGPITYSVTAPGTAGCSIANAASPVVSFTSVGTCEVVATAAATGAYSSATSKKTLKVLYPQTLTWNPVLSVFAIDSPLSFAAATTSGNGAISYVVTSSGTTGCTLGTPTSPVLTFTAPGACSISATANPNATFGAASTTKTFTISLAPQTITWAPTLSALTTASPLSFAAATTSGNGAITYAVSSAGTTACAIPDASSPLVTFTSPGSCAIRASAAATTTYAAATNTQTFTIQLPSQTLTWSPTLSVLATDSPLTFASATSSGDGAITYTVSDAGTTGCAIANAAVPNATFAGAGSCAITAAAAGTAGYAAASTTKTFTISLAPQTITWTPTLSVLTTATPLRFATATTSGAGAITYQISAAGTTGCSIVDAAFPIVSFSAAGSCAISALAAATARYEAASTTKTFTISLAPQTITWAPTLSVLTTASPFTFAAATTSGNGAVTYAVMDATTSGCAIANAATPILTFTGVGSCAVRATAAATATYSGAGTTLTFSITRFTDDPLQPGITVIKALHVTELRKHIDVLRGRHGMAAYVWTDATLAVGGTGVKAAHIAELRDALQSVYVAAGRTPPIYADSVLTGGSTSVKAIHLTEIRAAIVAIY